MKPQTDLRPSAFNRQITSPLYAERLDYIRRAGGRNKGKRFPAETISAEECWQLIEATHSRGNAIAERDRATIAVLWRTGIRIGEFCSLRMMDLDLEKGTLRVLWPKGWRKGKPPRVLGIDRIVQAELKRWVAVRSAWPGVPRAQTVPLFCTKRGGNLDPNQVRFMLRRTAGHAGIKRRIHPHMFRHTFAMECVLEGQPTPWVQRALGHESLAVTEKYLDHIAPRDVIAAMRERGV